MIHRAVMSAVNRNISVSYQAETIDYMGRLGIAANSTVYYSGTAQEITGTGIWNAVDWFVVQAVSAGLLAKRWGYFPVIGGTALRHKHNLISSALTIEFFNSWTHAKTGFTGDGVSTFARFLKSGTGQSCANLWSTIGGVNNASIAMYSRTNSLAAGQIEFGQRSQSVGFPNDALLSFYYGGSSSLEARMWDFNNKPSYSTPSTLGYVMANRASSTDFRAVVNGSQVGSTITTANTYALPDGADFYIGAFNNSGSATNNTAREFAFLAGGTGLTPSEAATESSIVNGLQTRLFRNVV